MSIVALRDIRADEEILVNYNYDVKLAPEWYRSLWMQHIKPKAEDYDHSKVNLNGHS